MDHSSIHHEEMAVSDSITDQLPIDNLYERFLIAVHYRQLEFETLRPHLSKKRVAKLQWYPTEMASA
jgi:hypothetical protein